MSGRHFSRVMVGAWVLAGALTAWAAQAACVGIGGGQIAIEGSAKPLLGKFTGKLNGVSAKETDGKIVFTADLMKNLDMAQRTEHTKEAFEIAKYPTARLSVERAKLKMPDDKAEVSGTVSADLTLHGTTKPVKVSYKASRTGSDYHIKSASFSFNYMDFKVKKICKLAVCVEPTVTLTAEGIKLREKL